MIQDFESIVCDIFLFIVKVAFFTIMQIFLMLTYLLFLFHEAMSTIIRKMRHHIRSILFNSYRDTGSITESESTTSDPRAEFQHDNNYNNTNNNNFSTVISSLFSPPSSSLSSCAIFIIHLRIPCRFSSIYVCTNTFVHPYATAVRPSSS